MRNDTSEKIVTLIKSQGQMTAKDLEYSLGISKQALFRQLKKLLTNEKIFKLGRPPKVFYFIREKQNTFELHDLSIDRNIQNIIQKNFLVITPLGERKEGWEGFLWWCAKTKQVVSKTADEYAKTLNRYDKFRQSGFIDGMRKLKNTFQKIYLDKLFYLDFYSIERFGKTKLGQILLYAKQSQDKKLIGELMEEIRPKVTDLIKKYNIDAIGFIPPTVKRELQLIREIDKRLHIDLPRVKITKIKTEIAIPQKTLSKLEDRVENARRTIIVEEKNKYKNILLIDDAVGSGATFNKTAQQIKKKGICKGKTIGLAITGSFKGFDVISEV